MGQVNERVNKNKNGFQVNALRTSNVPKNEVLSGGLAGQHIFFYCVGPNPAAGTNDRTYRFGFIFQKVQEL